MTYIGSETIGAGNQVHYWQDGDGATYAQDCCGARCGTMLRVQMNAADVAQLKASTPQWWRDKMAQEAA